MTSSIAPRAGRTRLRGIVAAGFTAAALMALSACSVVETGHATSAPVAVASELPLSQLDTLADPTTYQGPSTAVLPHADIVPVDDAPVQTLPAQVDSKERDGDVPVEVTDTSRVIALDISGSIAGTVYGLGLGDTLVARDVSTEFPSAMDLPVVTSGGHTINPEAVLELEPTLVLTDGSIGPSDSFQQLRDAGVTVVYVDNDPSFDGAQVLSRQVADALGVPDAGEALAQRIATEMDAVAADVADVAPAADEDRLRMMFLYLRGGSGVYYIFGAESGADVLIDALGGIDAATDADITGMQPLTDEAMLAADPDLILVMTGGLESVNGVDGLLAAKPAVALSTAGENRRIVDMADGDILSFGPRSAQIVEALAIAVYAPDAR